MTGEKSWLAEWWWGWWGRSVGREILGSFKLDFTCSVSFGLWGIKCGKKHKGGGEKTRKIKRGRGSNKTKEGNEEMLILSHK